MSQGIADFANCSLTLDTGMIIGKAVDTENTNTGDGHWNNNGSKKRGPCLPTSWIMGRPLLLSRHRCAPVAEKENLNFQVPMRLCGFWNTPSGLGFWRCVKRRTFVYWSPPHAGRKYIYRCVWSSTTARHWEDCALVDIRECCDRLRICCQSSAWHREKSGTGALKQKTPQCVSNVFAPHTIHFH